MKRGQKNRRAGIFSDFFMTRKGVKKYSKEWPYLTKKDCSLWFNMEQSFFSQMGLPFTVSFDPFFQVMKKSEKNSVLLLFCPLFIYVIKF
jgi:uncharacterized protein YneF (UPF0154 family)